MKLLLILLAAIWLFSLGKPVEDAIIIIENARSRNPVAWQKTGETGKVSIAHLDAGNYRVVIELPHLDGKWINTKRRYRTLAKAAYNPKNKTYYYQGEEGFFAIKFNKTARIESENFSPVFRELRTEDGFQYVVADFQTTREGARISVQVKKITAAQFKRKTEKIDQDISVISIPDFN
jgi:hypothetical protein